MHDTNATRTTPANARNGGARARTLRTAAAVLGVAGVAAGSLVVGTGTASASDLDGYIPVSDPGSYNAPDMTHYRWKFFRTPDGRNCGIAPNGGESGCDAVPYYVTGANETVVASYQAASFVQSETPRFTLPGGQKTLPEGYKLNNEGTECGVGRQGTVTCESASHGFTLSATYAVLY